jgi:hypothetical protein
MQDGKSDISAAHVGLLDATAPPIVNVALSPAPQALAARAAPPVIQPVVATIQALLLGLVVKVCVRAAIVEVESVTRQNKGYAHYARKYDAHNAADASKDDE